MVVLENKLKKNNKIIFVAIKYTQCSEQVQKQSSYLCPKNLG
jgi:hypothetical protein